MTLEEARAGLKKLQAKLSAYNHATALIFYDGVTTAPKGVAENRAQTLSVLSEEMYLLTTGKETVELLTFLDEKKEELTEKEKRQVEILFKSIKDTQKIPMDEYVEYQRLLVEADDVWHTAKEESNFALFEPILEKIFETQKKFAAYTDPEKDSYDHWLNEYEDGLNKEICDRFFGTLRERLVPLIKKIGEKEQVSNDCLKGDFPFDKQEEFSYFLMKTIGLDLNKVGFGTTEHPFTISFGSHNDERITTHFHKEDLSYSMFSVIHEGGHALYDTHSAPDLAYTVLDGGVSMGIHESQSRFVENILGRSREFAYYIFPEVVKYFPEVGKYTEEDFYKAINRVEPSLIRTEADELTYSLHVMIRYEIEKKVMAGELKVHDIPSEWNRLYKEYLGVDVPDDKRGCLQDSHWSGGSVGYFPSYALGSAYGAQFLSKMMETVDVYGDLKKGDFTNINKWNEEHIWKYGSLYKPGKLLSMVFEGKEFDPEFYIEYLEKKYKAIYGIE
ncbi:MAG: carboxypeptidase M32 [Clostridia bacterium]|nr:carboxypeptidase M32 [Clostridia bacterium]